MSPAGGRDALAKGRPSGHFPPLLDDRDQPQKASESWHLIQVYSEANLRQKCDGDQAREGGLWV